MKGLQYIKNADIHPEKWDRCIERTGLSLPYALHWYLHAVAENWDALVLDDYRAVMPLVWLRKMGVKCVYQPYYCQQLGVFGSLTRGEEAQMVATAVKSFAYLQINMHAACHVPAAGFKCIKKKNLLLPLSGPAAGLKKQFSQNHQRNIKKALKAGLQLNEENGLQQFQDFYLGNINRQKEVFKPEHERVFKKITAELVKQDKGKIYAITGADGEWQAALMLLSYRKRLINIINTSNMQGKAGGASHLLFSLLIEKYAGSDLIFDFEGSSIPSIARFYEGFGAQPETFYTIQSHVLKRISQRFL